MGSSPTPGTIPFCCGSRQRNYQETASHSDRDALLSGHPVYHRTRPIPGQLTGRKYCLKTAARIRFRNRQRNANSARFYRFDRGIFRRGRLTDPSSRRSGWQAAFHRHIWNGKRALPLPSKMAFTAAALPVPALLFWSQNFDIVDGGHIGRS